MATRNASGVRTRLLRAVSGSASVTGAAGAWVSGRPGLAITLLVTVNLAIPLCVIFIQQIVLPTARGVGRALEPGIQGSIERYFQLRYARTDRKIQAERSSSSP
jgi:hypothetical protein